ncbi:MAG: hypothetical protein RL173_659, partial [Fibrobacterota bacterium]
MSKLMKFFGGSQDDQPAEKSGCSGGCSCDAPVDNSRRAMLGTLAVVGAGAALMGVSGSDADKPSDQPKESPQDEAERLKFKEYLRKNYQIMTDEERRDTVKRLERLAWLEQGVDVRIRTTKPRKDVLFGYAFNISKCKGYMECVKACAEENNQDR